jgi:uncharacterized protein DUF3515
LAAAIALPLIAIVVVVVLAGRIGSQPATDPTAPLALGEIEAPGAATPGCAELMADVPTVLGGLDRRELVGSPAATGGTDLADRTQDGTPSDLQAGAVAAWGDPPVVLRCGIPTPAELTCSAPVQVVDGVTWLPLSGQGGTTYLVVDRSVRIALTVPDSVTGTGPWQAMSKTVARALPPRAICADGVPIPADGE